MKSTASSKELNARFKSEPEGAGEWAGGGGVSTMPLYPLIISAYSEPLKMTDDVGRFIPNS